MVALFTTLIAGALCIFKVIAPGVFVFIVGSSVVAEIVCSVLYFKIGAFKLFYHDVLGWHTPDDSPHWSDGCSEHAACKHCGRDIMQDSQGNWFC